MRSRIVSNDVVKAQVLKACANGASSTRISSSNQPQYDESDIIFALNRPGVN